MVYTFGERCGTSGLINAGDVFVQLWNPDSSDVVKLRSFHLASVGAGDLVRDTRLRRSTSRGATPALTVTPDLDNASNRGKAPPSGLVMEFATFGTQPTLDTSDLDKWRQENTAANFQGIGTMLVAPRPIEIPPGTGLCIVTLFGSTLGATTQFECWAEVED